jgi:hypothetical protein
MTIPLVLGGFGVEYGVEIRVEKDRTAIAQNDGKDLWRLTARTYGG